MAEKKRILIVDDIPRNLELAREQLGEEYDLTFATTPLEAISYITGKPDRSVQYQKFFLPKALAAGLPIEGEYKWTDERRRISDEAEAEFLALITGKQFDVVMTDCMMPIEHGDPKAWGGEIPGGLVVAIVALREDVPIIIIVSNKDHHKHPILHMMDAIEGPGRIAHGCRMEWVKRNGEDVIEKQWKKTLEDFSS